VPSYVPNDTILIGGEGEDMRGLPEAFPILSQQSSVIGSDCSSMVMMTGPNYSGKSVYVKQVALIVYLAHLGCFVPATRAIIGLTDKILTRLATAETVSKVESAFMTDLQQVSSALNLATHRSLLVIDEFGKGTDSFGEPKLPCFPSGKDLACFPDGAGLACGVFEYLLSLGEQRPKVLGTTHFHEIFESGFLKPRPELSFGHMEVRVDMEAFELENQISYLYK
jgi:DNA mismatch repair protein MSH5